MKKIFLICPVRDATPNEAKFLEEYTNKLESEGYNLYYPARDTNQDDPNGYNICFENRRALMDADEVHIYWSDGSVGSKFDFGMAFMARKPIKIINPSHVAPTPHKSFRNVLLKLHEQYMSKAPTPDIEVDGAP
jgi:hypothetical protein